MATQIRDGKLGDEDAIVGVYNSSWRRAFKELFPEDYLASEKLLESQRAEWTRRLSPDGPFFPVRVAEENNKVVGVCAWEPDGDTVELTAIYVLPLYWSTGIGSALQRDARPMAGRRLQRRLSMDRGQQTLALIGHTKRTVGS